MKFKHKRTKPAPPIADSTDDEETDIRNSQPPTQPQPKAPKLLFKPTDEFEIDEANDGPNTKLYKGLGNRFLLETTHDWCSMDDGKLTSILRNFTKTHGYPGFERYLLSYLQERRPCTYYKDYTREEVLNVDFSETALREMKTYKALHTKVQEMNIGDYCHVSITLTETGQKYKESYEELFPEHQEDIRLQMGYKEEKLGLIAMQCIQNDLEKAKSAIRPDKKQKKSTPETISTNAASEQVGLHFQDVETAERFVASSHEASIVAIGRLVSATFDVNNIDAILNYLAAARRAGTVDVLLSERLEELKDFGA